MYIGIQVQYPLFLSDFNKIIFFDRFSKNIEISIFLKICPVGAELFHADGQMDRQTDMTKLTVVFHSFVNMPDSQWQ
jgi:hypothetical protein